MTTWTGRIETVAAFVLLLAIAVLASGCAGVSKSDFDRFKVELGERLDAVAEAHERARATADLLAEAAEDEAADRGRIAAAARALAGDLDAAAGALEQAREAVR